MQDFFFMIVRMVVEITGIWCVMTYPQDYVIDPWNAAENYPDSQCEKSEQDYSYPTWKWNKFVWKYEL